MHMADALISPSVGAVMTAASIGLLGYSIKKVKQDLDEKKNLYVNTSCKVKSVRVLTYCVSDVIKTV